MNLCITHMMSMHTLSANNCLFVPFIAGKEEQNVQKVDICST